MKFKQTEYLNCKTSRVVIVLKKKRENLNYFFCLWINKKERKKERKRIRDKLKTKHVRESCGACRFIEYFTQWPAWIKKKKLKFDKKFQYLVSTKNVHRK